MGVIDKTEQRPIGGHLGQEAEHRQGDGEAVVGAAGGQRERAPQGGGLHLWYPVDVRERGSQQLVQGRERELDLGLHPRGLEDPQVGAAAAGVVEQG